MIGQENLLNDIDNQIDNDTLPRFILIEGPKGSGKKLLAHYIAIEFHSKLATADISIASIRDIIAQAYKQKEECCYILTDVDNMSNAAKNALLKVTEEPPNNAYFIMTIEDANNTLETIRSRATIYRMEPYTINDIEDFYTQTYTHGTKEEKALVKEMCETPGDVIHFVAQNPLEFMDYVKLVSNNIAEVSGANSFKIPSKVALKDDAEGYDLKMFWKLFAKYSFQMALESEGINKLTYLHRVGITSQYIQSLRVKGINKQMLIDTWILDIRKETLDGAK